MTFFLKGFLCVVLMVFCIEYQFAQCPPEADNPDFIINTQEKYDTYVLQHPDCGWHIVMVNNRFIGEPQPVKYVIVMTLLFGLILLLLKIAFFVARKLRRALPSHE